MSVRTKSPTLTACLALVAAGLLPATATHAATTGAAPAAPAASTQATPSIPTLVAIRAAHHPGYDRVVFEFAGALPAQRTVRYVDELLGDGSGLPLPISGRAILEVSFQHAQAHTDEGAPTVPHRVAYALPNVLQLVQSGDFEAVTTYGIGLAARQPYKVMTLRNPSRFVIDIGTGFRTVNRSVSFLHGARYAAGQEPYVVSVRRPLPLTAPATAALDRVFAGPTAAEERVGLQAVTSGATGFTSLRVESGVAHVQLTGNCSSGGSTMTIANLIRPTLKQFPTVRWVKIYDAWGRTGSPTGHSDSIPPCLEP